MMKLLPILFAALVLASCQADSQRDRALGGGALGGITGAAIGGAAGGTRGALVGGVIGGAAGAIAGSATTPKNCVDGYGNAVPCP
ncbi:glycine zipper domain-containing protein [Acuticoccus mangrovi]|uniref:Bacteriocin n=1 Tax=Acuticoccus mangrovi TaxID=2796142 RepID=A0A934IE91_9HYPH|nr:glycine zipper domain-containing protein [Acuticoccus mangrovi]MBJ3774979.1 bacteriocin [Acuticoccus mangrovi]